MKIATKRVSLASGRWALLLLATVIFYNCDRDSVSGIPEPPAKEFSRYISAFSGGILSTEETVRVQFAFPVADTASVGKEVPRDLFRIRPSVEGKTFWKDTRTLEFRPAKPLAHDRVFQVRFDLSALLNVDKELREFAFGFATMPQSVNVYVRSVKTYRENQQDRIRLTGIVESADAAEPEKVREMVKLRNGGRDASVSWKHEQQNRKHTFTINNLSRSQGETRMTLEWNGKPVEAKEKGVEEIHLPAPGSFELIHTWFEQLPEPRISLHFSEPLQQQNLSGLVYFADQRNLKTRINGNEIVIFPPEDLNGTQILNIEASLRDENGNRLNEKLVRQFVFEDIKPAVRLTGRGVITPSSGELLFPFEAVNLAAVDVEVVQILEDNILQFLQTNPIDGEDQLRRVGRIVARRTLSLATGEVTNLNQWNPFALDLAEVLPPDPGAIYRVYLSFSKDYSLYPCDGGPLNPSSVLASLDTRWEKVSDEVSYWGGYGKSQRYNYDDYDWRERDNPCHNTYFYNQSAISRNILASNLGLIAKKQDDGVFHFTVTDLLSASPVGDTRISLYNFQQQLLETVETDAQGFATVESRGVPFVAVAEKNNQKAYLRLDDGNTLSLSMFDVGGQRVQKGLKGFLYGERGVWRPGDTLFLNFVLEDRQQTLPEGYPVVFQLYNPLGQRVVHKVATEGVNGFYRFTALTDSDAPTGNYTASVKLGGVEFSQSLRIETIMPNRLRINTAFEGNTLLGYSANTGTLEAEWLHGGTARNLRAEVTATLNPAKTQFDDFAGYVFDDPTRSFSGETFPLFEGRLNARGQARLKADIDVQSRAPGMLSATVETKVFEEGGAFSIDRFNLPFYSYDTYAGVQKPQGREGSGALETDSIYRLALVNVDREGNPVQDARMRVDVYKINWRWWWDASDENLGDFSSGSYNKAIHTEIINAEDGQTHFNLGIEYPEWGRYLVLVTDLASGHRSGDILYFDWPSWRGVPRDGRQQAATMLTFTADKEQYQPGEQMQFTFPSSEGGRALVSMESGSKVLESKWVKTRKDNTSFSIEVTPEMAPNVYAHITLLQPHAQTANDLPIRLYGVLPLKVEDPDTRLQPQIIMEDALKPGQEVDITVKEQQGRAMTYTLALVDEGLLDLTRFHTPDPHGSFYAREALGVKTWDMFDYVMGAFGNEFSRLLATGGDDFIQPPVAGERASRFKPVVRHFGPFALDKGKSKTHTFTMPQYAGSVRVMVVAGQEGAYGNAEKTVPVRQSLMALGTLPRVMGPGETVSFPVNVFALDETVKQAQISISTNDLFSVKGERIRSIEFREPGDEMVWFELETPNREGIAKVSATVKSGSETVTFDIELDVRNPNTRQTSVENLVLDGSETADLSFDFSGMQSTREATLEIASIPPINLEKRLRFLTSYPHGCSEQIVSGAFPQLFIETFYELSENEKAKIQSNVESVINKLSARQTANGGIVMWPGASGAHEWVSSYAGHFALEAQKKGFALPAGFTDNWARFQQQMASRWVPDVETQGSDLMQAYRLYTLALANKSEMGAMNRLRQQPSLSVQARWQLAAAYLLSGQEEAARQLVEEATTQVEPYRQLSYTFGNPLRDKARIIPVLMKLNRREDAALLVKELADEFASSRWLSTQTTAFGLLALAEFYQGTTPDGGIQISWAQDGGSMQDLNTTSLVSLHPLTIPSGGNPKQLSFANNGDNPVFIRVVHSGIPRAGEEVAESANLEMSVRFTGLDGSTLDVSRLRQGTSFIAEVTLSHPGIRGEYREMALTRIFPSGWEIGNVRMDAASGAIQQDISVYEDIRDDRVYTYFDLPGQQSRTYKVMLTAAYAGRFYLPAFNTEAMYDASIYARNKGQWVEVVKE